MTTYMGLRHTYERRGHFLETRTQIVALLMAHGAKRITK